MSLINDALKRANQAQKQNAPDRPQLAPLQPVEARKPGIDWSSYLLPATLAVVLMAAGAFLWSWASSRRAPSTEGEAARASTPAKAATDPSAGKTTVDSTLAKSAPVPPPVAVASKPAVKISTNIVVRPAVQVNKPVAVASVPAPETAAPAATVTSPAPPPPVPVPARPVAPASAPAPAAAISPSDPAPAPASAVVTPPVRVETAAPAAPPQPPPVAVVPKPVVAEAPPKPEFPHLKVQGIVFRRTNPSAYVNGRPCYVGDTIEGARITKIERLSVFFDFGGQTRELNLEP